MNLKNKNFRHRKKIKIKFKQKNNNLWKNYKNKKILLIVRINKYQNNQKKYNLYKMNYKKKNIKFQVYNMKYHYYSNLVQVTKVTQFYKIFKVSNIQM